MLSLVNIDISFNEVSIILHFNSIDKIIELAPRWLYTTCDEIDEQQTDDKKNTHLTKSDPNKYQHIRSTATGESIDKNKTKIDPFISTRNQLGTFSRLLFCAHDQLQKKRQLEKMPDTGIYVTKSELRAPNTNLFLLRKVYITPSTIFYEGPFREESCVVTRQFAQYQDRFLRVSFRDEGRLILFEIQTYCSLSLSLSRLSYLAQF